MGTPPTGLGEESNPPGFDDPASTWMLAVTKAMERLRAQQQAIEKSLDQNTSVLIVANKISEAATSALTRIANAEEERVRILRLQEEESVRQRREKEKFFSRIWQSDAAKLLLMGLVMALLNFLGVGAIVSTFQGD